MDELARCVEAEIPHLQRFARSLCGSQHEGDDLVQDALERAWRKRQSWRQEGSVRSWLFKILYRVFLNSRRGERIPHEEVHEESMTAAGVESIPPQEARLMADDMVRSLAVLPEEQRAPVLLVALENVSYDEAAAILGIPVGTLRSRLSRGREALRASMRGKGELAMRTQPQRRQLRRVK